MKYSHHFAIIFFLFAFIFFIEAFATHNRGGEITYRWISGYTYQITITTYTKTSSCPPACRPSLDTVRLGDGTLTSFTRNYSVDLPGDVTVNKYSRLHSYPGQGIYRIYFVDPNRDVGICNIPNSVNVPFCTESYLYAFDTDSFCPNSSNIFQTLPLFVAEKNTAYLQNVIASDADTLPGNTVLHDSLSYQLVQCLGENALPIPGYSFPSGIYINPVSGEVKWNITSADSACEYNIAVRVSEWRKGNPVGSVTRDYQLEVYNRFLSTYYFIPPAQMATDSSGNYSKTVNAGDTVIFNVGYYDNYSGILNHFGDEFNLNNRPVIITSNAGDTAFATFFWITDSTNPRNYPYQFIFRGSSNGFDSIVNDLSVLIYVNGNYQDTVCPVPPVIHVTKKESDSDGLKIFPNPSYLDLSIILPQQISQSDELTISIFNMLGQLQRKEIINWQQDFTLDIRDLNCGIYFLEIEAANNKWIEKFMKYRKPK